MTAIEKLLDTSSPTWIAQWDVESETSGEIYKVSQKYDSSWACSCKHWIFMKKPKQDCRHILKVKATEGIRVTARDFIEARRATKDTQVMARRIQKAVPTPEPVVFIKQTVRKIYSER